MEVFGMLRLNPFCDVIFYENRVQFRLPTRVVTLEGETISEIIERSLPDLERPFTLEDFSNLFKNYEVDEMQSLVQRLRNEEVIDESFPTDISGKLRLKRFVPEEKKSNSKIGIVERGNISLVLEKILSKHFSASLLTEPLSISSEIDWIVFLPEELGIKDQKALEGFLGKANLITGFRKDAIYYAFFNGVGDTESVFLRIFRGLYLPEDLDLGRLIYTQDQMIGKGRSYFGEKDAEWIACDLAQEVISLIFEKGKASLAEGVIIYDLPIKEKRFSVLVDSKRNVSKRGIKERFVGEASIIPEIEVQLPRDSRFRLPFHLYTARYSSSNNFFIQQEESRLSGGASKDRKTAELKAIVEGIERYSAGVYDLDKLKLGRASEQDEDYVNPAKLVAYHSRQYTNDFPLRPFDAEAEFLWKRCHNLTQKKPVYVIADCVFYPFYVNPKEKPYTLANSSGMAAHLDLDSAVREAIFELCERDAFMVTWLNRLSMPLIRGDSLPGNISKRLKNIKLMGREVYLIDISLDLFPVVLALSVSENGFPAFLCGAGSDADPAKAMEKALAELEISMYFSYSSKLFQKKAPEAIRFPSDHAALFYDRKNLWRTRFLFRSKQEKSLKEMKEYRGGLDVKGICSYFAKKGFDVIMVDLTPREVKRFSSDFKVVRVFVPGMVPIYFGTKFLPLGMKRLFTLPKTLGYLNSELAYEEIDKFPHPFP